MVHVIQVGDVGPVILRSQVAVGIQVVPVAVLTGPGMVAARMVGHPVENYLEALFVGNVQEVVEVLQCAELGVHGTIILDGVIAAERAFAAFHSNRMDGHQPKDVDAQFGKPVKLRLDGGKGSFRGELAHVHLIDDGVLRPFGMEYMGHIFLRGGLLAGHQAEEDEQETQDLFHIAITYLMIS